MLFFHFHHGKVKNGILVVVVLVVVVVAVVWIVNRVCVYVRLVVFLWVILLIL